jgi:asparagine synthase (glutamine-hydrolysing)
MLRFRVHASDLRAPWLSVGRRWCAGDSFIEPYAHPALEGVIALCPPRTLFVVRERLRGRSEPAHTLPPGARVDHVTLSSVLDETRAWPLEATALLLDQHKGVSIFSGRLGSAPVYALERADTLHGSWDPADLYQYLDSARLDFPLAAALLLRSGFPYSRRTVIPAIHCLTERSEAAWGGQGGLEVGYPAACERTLPSKLRTGADVVGAFEAIATASLRRWDNEAAPFAAELSGGLDTSLVSLIASRLSPRPLRSYGLVMPGEPGAGQRARRSEIIRLGGLTDHSVEADRFPPFSIPSSRLNLHLAFPGQENYYEAFEQMVDLAIQNGSHTLLTGNGGDELCFPHYEELSDVQRASRREAVEAPSGLKLGFLTPATRDAYRETYLSLDRAPRPASPRSGLHAAAASAPLYLRKGVWAISPLCAPEFVAFCRRLPREWREGRRVQREFLLRAGCSRDLAYPQSAETFEPVLQRSLRVTAAAFVRALFRESRLAEQGLVHADKLVTAYQEYVESGGADMEDVFYGVAILELTIRSIEARAGCRTSSVTA